MGHFFIIFSILSASLLPSKCGTFPSIFHNYYEFVPNSFKIIIPIFNMVGKFLQNFTVVDSFRTFESCKLAKRHISDLGVTCV